MTTLNPELMHSAVVGATAGGYKIVVDLIKGKSIDAKQALINGGAVAGGDYLSKRWAPTLMTGVSTGNELIDNAGNTAVLSTGLIVGYNLLMKEKWNKQLVNVAVGAGVGELTATTLKY